MPIYFIVEETNTILEIENYLLHHPLYNKITYVCLNYHKNSQDIRMNIFFLLNFKII